MNKYVGKIVNLIKKNKYSLAVMLVFCLFTATTLVVVGSFDKENRKEPVRTQQNELEPISFVTLKGDPNLVYQELYKDTGIEGTLLSSQNEDQIQKDEEEKVKQSKETQEKETQGNTQSEEPDHTDDMDTGEATGEEGLTNDQVVNQPKDNDSKIDQTVGDNKIQNASEYFKTSIKNNEIVTKRAYYFTITQKNHGLQVLNTQIVVNEKDAGVFNGNINLNRGDNLIQIKITYQRKDGSKFAVIQKYTVKLELKDVVIYTDIEDKEIVRQEQYTFEAYAKVGTDKVQVTVSHNQKNIKPIKGNQYQITLEAGENTIIIAAQNSEGKTKEQSYQIVYEPLESQLKFDTDLYNQEVISRKFEFWAKAYNHEQSIEFIVKFNNEVIDAEEDERFGVELVDGVNTIQLYTQFDGKELIQEYEIIYTEPDIGEGDGDEDQNSPTIYCDLVDNEVVVGSIKNFELHAKDYKGNYIDTSNIQVYCNAQSAELIWANLTQISYRLKLKTGDNEVKIQATDNEGNTKLQTYHIKSEAIENGTVIGTVTISLEASTVGIPYIIPPTQVELRYGENAAYMLDRLLKENQFTYEKTGTLDAAFYLANIIFNRNLMENVSIPEDLSKLCEQTADYYDPKDYYMDQLGEFDFCCGAGWMYSVNGVYPNYGFSDCYMKPDDVMRIRFTLFYGKDIGGAGALGNEGSDEHGGNWSKEW